MKNQLLFAFFFLTMGLGAQTVFVDADNATPGDGSSWANAYANLNDAINTSAAGSVLWVAEGTYVTPDTASFYIAKELTILGGFAGTEAAATEANPTDNPTILSGDVLGNDPATTFDSLLAVDNNRVLLVEDTAQTSKFLVTLDGLTITNGIIAAEYVEGDVNPFAGGGILALGKVNGSRLTFTANRATRGAALFVRTTASDGSTFDDLTVTGNYNSSQRAVYIRENNNVLIENSDFQGLGDAKDGSGAFFAFRTDGMIVRNCSFSNINSAASGGGGAASRCTNVLFEDCNFDGVVTDGWGGGLNFFNTDVRVSGCTFNDNVAVRNGAALYYQTSTEGLFDVRVENCTFNDNAGGAFGGSTAFLAFDESTFDVTFDGCTIKGGTASNNGRGGACYAQNGNDITLLNSTIEDNVAQGGAFVVNGAASLTVFKSNFLNNGNSFEAGRGALVGFMDDPVAAEVSIDSSLFEGNQIVAIGGFFSAGAAVYLFGGRTVPAKLDITNTTFSNNATTDAAAGGAVYTSLSWDVTIDNVDFLNNTCGDIGGALHSRAFESVRDTSEAGDITVEFQDFTGKVTNSRFLNNLSQTQGGAIGTFNAAYDVSNSVFVGNTIAGGGASGGAIIFNGLSPFFNDDGTLGQSAALDLTSTLVNNTFFGNLKGNADGAVGNDIALFQRGLTGQDDIRSVSMTIANNAFFQLDGEPSIEIEPGVDDNEITAVGNIALTSLGGNFFNNEIDPDLDPANDNDIVDENFDESSEIEALFVDITDEEGEGVNADLVIPADLTDNPLINTGLVNAIVPVVDIRGNPRGDFPDIGAYEADQSAVSTDQPIADSGLKLTFYPNPTKDALTIQNDDPTISNFTVLLADQRGRTLSARSFSGASNQLDMTTLPAGVYNLRLVINGKVYGQQVVKQ